MRSISCGLVALVLISLSGCGGSSSGSPTPVVLQSIQVTPSAPSVNAGSTQQFKATGSYSDSTTKDLTSSVTWSSSTTATATVSAGGLATAAAQGTTTITATSGTISGSTVLTVPGPVSIVVTPATPSIAALTSVGFIATGTYADGSSKIITSQVTWTSSNTSVATISNAVPTQGTAMALAAGTSTITASSGSVTGTATLTVTSATLNSIAVTPAGSTIPLGVQQQFTATGTFSDSTTQDITNTVTWASSGSSFASITVSGLATGLKLGSVTISATSGAVSGNTSLTINAANLASLAITPLNPSIAASTSERFAAVGTFNDGSTKNLTGQAAWTSSNTAVATIGSANGVAKGLTAGSATITATIGSKSASTPLTVTSATVTSISVTPSGRSIAAGTKLALTATAAFSDTTTQVVTTDVAWTSDHNNFATVNTVGTATGVAAGAANITATLGGISGSAPLTVTAATLVSLAVTPSTTVLAPSSTLVYQASGTYSDSTTQNISNVATWTSDTPSVVSITSSGQATGQSAGTAIITATLGSVSNTANVVVEGSALQSITVASSVTTSIPAQVAVQYTATAHFADGSTQNITSSVTWTSSKSSVATISNSTGISGLAVAVAPGTSTITAAFSGVVGTATLTVNSATLTSVTVSPSSATIARNGSQQFNANGNFSDATTFNMNSQVTWTSSKVDIAVVNGGGLANGVAAGTTNIKAALGSTNGTAVLTVQ